MRNVERKQKKLNPTLFLQYQVFKKNMKNTLGTQKLKMHEKCRTQTKNTESNLIFAISSFKKENYEKHTGHAKTTDA